MTRPSSLIRRCSRWMRFGRWYLIKYSVISSPDALGWRIYYLRQMFHKSAKVLNTDAQGAFVNILGNIAFGRFPRDVLPFFSSCMVFYYFG